MKALKSFLTSFALFLTAITLFVVFVPIGFIWQLCDRLFHLDDYFYDLADAFDKTGNVFCASMFNTLLIKRAGDKFGVPDEYISSVLGKNKETNTLTILGSCLSNFLDKIEKNHVEKAIQNNI